MPDNRMSAETHKIVVAGHNLLLAGCRRDLRMLHGTISDGALQVLRDHIDWLEEQLSDLDCLECDCCNKWFRYNELRTLTGYCATEEDGEWSILVCRGCPEEEDDR